MKRSGPFRREDGHRLGVVVLLIREGCAFKHVTSASGAIHGYPPRTPTGVSSSHPCLFPGLSSASCGGARPKSEPCGSVRHMVTGYRLWRVR